MGGLVRSVADADAPDTGARTQRAAGSHSECQRVALGQPLVARRMSYEGVGFASAEMPKAPTRLFASGAFEAMDGRLIQRTT